MKKTILLINCKIMNGKSAPPIHNLNVTKSKK